MSGTNPTYHDPTRFGPLGSLTGSEVISPVWDGSNDRSLTLAVVSNYIRSTLGIASMATKTAPVSAPLVSFDSAGNPVSVAVGSGLSLLNSVLTATGTSGSSSNVTLSAGSTGLTVGTAPNFVLGGVLGVPNGGTGATSAVGVRTALGLAPVAASGAYSDITGTPSFSPVAISGNAGDLSIGTLNAARLPLATAGSVGGVRPDGSTITAVNGVLTANTSGVGTVSSVNVSGGSTGLTFGGGPITGAGTITAAGTLQVAAGGTGGNTLSQAQANLGLAAVALSGNYADLAGAPQAVVTSVALSGGTTGLTATGGPITTAGTITLSGTLGVANGGTGSTNPGAARTALGVSLAGASGSYTDLTNRPTLGTIAAHNSLTSAPLSGFDASGNPVAVTVGGGLTLTAGALAATGGLGAQANNTVVGNVSGSTAVPGVVTQAQLTALVSPFTTSTSGAAPASPGGTTQFLRADGSYAVPPGTGSITIPTASLLGGTGSALSAVTVGTNLAFFNGTLTASQLHAAGGIGDGTSHTVDAVIGATIAGYSAMGSVAKLNAINASTVYPCGAYATSLTSQIDWCAWCLVQAQLIAAGGGVLRPAVGTWMFDAPLPNIPAAVDTAGARQATISIAGAGSMHTYLVFMNDVGSTFGGSFAINCAGRSNGDATTWAGFFQGFTMIGPGPGAVTFGSTNTHLSGIGWGARRTVDDVHIRQFYAGIHITGDQASFSNLVVSQCTFGILFDLPNAILNTGDLLFAKTKIALCSIAGVAVSAAMTMTNALWVKPTISQVPIAVVKLINSSDPNWTPAFITNTEFVSPRFWGLGYAAFAEISTTTLRPSPSATSFNSNVNTFRSQNTILGPWDTTYKFPTLNPSAMFEFNAMQGACKLEMSGEASWTPGSNGMINVTFFDNFVIVGDADQLAANVHAVTNTSGYARSLFLSSIATGYNVRLVGKYNVTIFPFNPGGAAYALGTTLTFTTVGPNIALPVGTAAGDSLGIGVAFMYRADGVSGLNYTPVVIIGAVWALCTTFSGTQWLKPTTSGTLTPATAFNDTTGYVAGQSVSGSATSGGIPGTATQVVIRLKQPPITWFSPT